MTNTNNLNRRQAILGGSALAAVALLPACEGTTGWAQRIPERLPYLQEHMGNIRRGTEKVLIADQSNDLSVFCQNVNGLPWPITKWGSRPGKHEGAAEFIAKNQPDFACLQEVIFQGDAEDYYGELGYHMTYQKGQHPFFNRGGLVTLSKEKPDMTDFSKYDDQGKFISMQWSDAWLEKGVQALFYTSSKLAVMNTHLAAGYGAEVNEGNIEQNKQLVEYIREIREIGFDVLLAGDFNYKESSEQYALMNEVTIDHTKNSGPTHSNGNRIDAVRSTFMNVPETETMTIETDSDHRILFKNIRGIVTSSLERAENRSL